MEKITEFTGEYAFLSNFYPSLIEMPDGDHWHVYTTVEHYFQSCKADNEEEKEAIRSAPTPGFAKNLGRQCHMIPDWDKVAYSYMTMGVFAKFQQNPALKEKLLATKDKYLIEGNRWHDNKWGFCTCKRCKNIYPKYNYLGEILMKVREFFKIEAEMNNSN